MNLLITKNLKTSVEEATEGTSAKKETAYVDHATLEDRDYRELDVLLQLKANVAQIENLQFRLNFLISEIGSCIKK